MSPLRGRGARGKAKKREGQTRQGAARPMEKAAGAAREAKGGVKARGEKISGNIKKKSNY